MLDKLIPLTPFWETVCDNLKRDDVMLSAGQYVYTPDDQPLIGPLPEVPGFYLNCGYWAGVMLAAAAGRRVADLVTGVLAPQAESAAADALCGGDHVRRGIASCAAITDKCCAGRNSKGVWATDAAQTPYK